MNFKVNDPRFAKFMQEGGVAPEQATAEAAPEAPELGGSPEELILQAAAQAVLTQDGNLALQVCQALIEMAGGGAPLEAPAAPEGQAPVYKQGGRFAYWTLK